jgi:hypothetical protein
MVSDHPVLRHPAEAYTFPPVALGNHDRHELSSSLGRLSFTFWRIQVSFPSLCVVGWSYQLPIRATSPPGGQAKFIFLFFYFGEILLLALRAFGPYSIEIESEQTNHFQSKSKAAPGWYHQEFIFIPWVLLPWVRTKTAGCPTLFSVRYVDLEGGRQDLFHPPKPLDPFST